MRAGGPLDHDELVAPEPCDDAGLRGRFPEPGGDLDEYLIADAVTESVVDHLEAIQVDEGDCCGGTTVSLCRDHLAQPAGYLDPVRQTGESVVAHVVVHLMCDALALGDVEHRPAQPVGGVLRCRVAHLHPAELAVRPEDAVHVPGLAVAGRGPVGRRLEGG